MLGYFKASNTIMKRLGICAFALMALVLLLGGVTSIKTVAQDSTWPPLPAPIIFFDSRENLVYIDPHTQTTKIFYTDYAFLRPLSWSPKGDLFLFFREPWGSDQMPTTKLCLLNRQGVLQKCFVDHVVNYWSEVVYDQLTATIWSEDGRHVYFMAHGKDGQRVRFVEAEVATGATSRVLYEVPEGSNTDFLAISKDLRYLLANTAAMGYFGTPYLVDLATKEEIPFNSGLSEESGRFFCLGFSPNSQYLVIRNFADDAKPVMEIVNLQGEVVHTIIGPEGEGLFRMTCPTWQADSNSLYFFALNTLDETKPQFIYLLRYNLTERQITSIHERSSSVDKVPGPSNLDSILKGAEAFVYESRDSVGVWLNGQAYKLDLPYEDMYEDMRYPIWSVDLSVPLTIPPPTNMASLTPVQSPTSVAWPPLPAPVIFYDFEGRLIYIDPHTQRSRIFYADQKGAFLRPLSWSPKGDLFLFFREVYKTNQGWTIELCLLNRQGVLQRCIAANAVNYYDDADRLAATQWSEDGRYVYLFAEYEDGRRERYVEAEVATGAISRMLYDVPGRFDSDFMAISKNLRYLLTKTDTAENANKPYLIDLATKEAIPFNSGLSGESGRFFCLGFSPNSQYLVIRNLADDAKPVMEIVNLQGEVVHTIIGPEGEGLFYMSCPTWQADSNSLYFFALNTLDEAKPQVIYTLRYNLTERQTTILHQQSSSNHAILGPADLDTLLGGTEAFVYQSRVISNDTRTTTLSVWLNGQAYELDLPHKRAFYPIWSIDLAVPLATPTPTQMSIFTPTPSPTPQAWPPLPAPILFTNREENLAYLDPYTRTIRNFYAADTSIRALSWSPQGDLLLFFRTTVVADQRLLLEFCLLNRQGVLQRCFTDDVVNAWGDGPHPRLGIVTWSEDGKHVYFLAYKENSWQKRFVEAEVATGATSRVLYEVPSDSIVDDIIISKNLRYLLAKTDHVGTGGAPYLVDLSTKEKIPLDSVGSAQSNRYFCLGFSPNSQYLVIRNLTNDDKPVMQIVNLRGKVVHTIVGTEGEGLFRMSCPTWQADSNSLYFFALNTRSEIQPRVFRLLRYNLTQKQTTTVYQFPYDRGAMLGPIIFDNAVEGTEAFVYQSFSLKSVGVWLNGQAYTLDLLDTNIRFPIWSIDLSVPLATPTPLPPS
jgi:WD40 repeat protein